MNFALLLSNLPGIYQVQHTLQVPTAVAPSIIKRMLSHLLIRLQHN